MKNTTDSLERLSAPAGSPAFTALCRKHGCYHDRCGLAVRDLVQQLRCAPISSEKSKAGTKMPHHSAMGISIMAGLVHYLPIEKCYVISPAGETWLAELEIHGLANTKLCSGTSATAQSSAQENSENLTK